MQQYGGKILPIDTSSTPGGVKSSKYIYFSESSHVAYQIKVNGA